MHTALIAKRLHQMTHFIVDKRIKHHQVIGFALRAMRFLMFGQKTRDFVETAYLRQRFNVWVGISELPRRGACERMSRRAKRVAYNMNRGKRRVVVHSNKSFIRCHACPLSEAPCFAAFTPYCFIHHKRKGRQSSRRDRRVQACSSFENETPPGKHNKSNRNDSLLRSWRKPRRPLGK